jgi:uncharacterized protein
VRRADVIARLKEAEPALRGLGWRRCTFSARTRATRRDRILMSTFLSMPCPTGISDFCPFMNAYEALQKAFGRDVEIGYSTREGLSPYIRQDVEREAVRIF